MMIFTLNFSIFFPGTVLGVIRVPYSSKARLRHPLSALNMHAFPLVIAR